MEQPLNSFGSLVGSVEPQHIMLLALALLGFTLIVNQFAAWGKHVARNLLVPKN